MQYIGIIKRVLPFLFTFTVGLFIASFFISIAAPSFDRAGKSRSDRWMNNRELRAENEQLRSENERLIDRIAELEQTANKHQKDCKRGKLNRGDAFISDLDRMVPPPAPLKEMKMMAAPAN